MSHLITLVRKLYIACDTIGCYKLSVIVALTLTLELQRKTKNMLYLQTIALSRSGLSGGRG